MQLSERLNMISTFVTDGYRLADIGTDHGYIPIMLVKKGTVPSALAMDIAKGPLERAKEHIEQYGLSEKIEVRLSDGLKELKPNEADSVIIAGMGGALTVKILKEGAEVLKSVKELILSPHTENFLVRQYLLNSGFDIVKEDMVFDMGKYYTVIKAVHVKDNGGYFKDVKKIYDANENYYIYGKLLIENRNPVFMDYLRAEKNKLGIVLENLAYSKEADDKKVEIKKRMEYIDTLL